jgi:hypothetical protein
LFLKHFDTFCFCFSLSDCFCFILLC